MSWQGDNLIQQRVDRENYTHKEKLMTKMKTRFLRNKDLIPLNKLSEIGIVGLGGIGSFLVQSLSIMGWKTIIGYDSDNVEEHNFSSTAYPLHEVGNAKSQAAHNLHKQYSEHWQTFLPEDHYDRGTPILPNMIVCTDDMESRKMVYERWKKELKNIHPREQFNDAFLIDLRMGATVTEMITVVPRHDNYMESWMPTADMTPEPCSMRHTVFATQHIVSYGVAQVYNVIANLAFYDYIRASLTPNEVEFGNLIVPTIKQGDADATKDSRANGIDRLEGNASRSDLSVYRAT